MISKLHTKLVYYLLRSMEYIYIYIYFRFEFLTSHCSRVGRIHDRFNFLVVVNSNIILSCLDNQVVDIRSDNLEADTSSYHCK